MRLSKKEKEILGWYAAENLVVFAQIIMVFVMFLMTEDMMFLVVELGLGAIVALNEVRAKL